MRPFNTYPEDRKKLLGLAEQAEWSDDAASIELGEMVKAILTDEAVAIASVTDTMNHAASALQTAETLLGFCINRLGGIQRPRDEELVRDLRRGRERLNEVLKATLWHVPEPSEASNV